MRGYLPIFSFMALSKSNKSIKKITIISIMLLLILLAAPGSVLSSARSVIGSRLYVTRNTKSASICTIGSFYDFCLTFFIENLIIVFIFFENTIDNRKIGNKYV